MKLESHIPTFESSTPWIRKPSNIRHKYELVRAISWQKVEGGDVKPHSIG